MGVEAEIIEEGADGSAFSCPCGGLGFAGLSREKGQVPIDLRQLGFGDKG